MALDCLGYVWTWGLNDKGQLGLNTGGYKEHLKKDTPTKVQNLSEIVQIYTGNSACFAIDNVGDVYAWGLNKNNCLLIN